MIVQGWSNPFVGIPFVPGGHSMVGCDCWGLLRLVYRRMLGVELPPYACDATPDGELGSGTVGAGSGGHVQPLDFLLWQYPGQCHVGIAVDARNYLHIQKGGLSKTDPLTIAKRRILQGVYRAAKG